MTWITMQLLKKNDKVLSSDIFYEKKALHTKMELL